MSKPTVASLSAEIAALRGALHSADQRIRVLERELRTAQRPARRAPRAADRPDYAGLTRSQIAIREHRRLQEARA